MPMQVDPALDRAKRHVSEIRDFFYHLMVFVLVNAMLIAIDLQSGANDFFLGLDWAFWVIFGWGFGLLGHLVEMVKASNTDVELELGKVPLLDGALEMVSAGITSSLQPQNLRLRRAVRDLDRVGADPRYPLLFDPQTAGGLLTSVPARAADACVAALHELGYRHAALIGQVLPHSNRDEPITVLT